MCCANYEGRQKSPDFCTGSCPLPESYMGAIGEQQLKRAKLIVAFIKIMHVAQC